MAVRRPILTSRVIRGLKHVALTSGEARTLIERCNGGYRAHMTPQQWRDFTTAIAYCEHLALWAEYNRERKRYARSLRKPKRKLMPFEIELHAKAELARRGIPVK